MQDVYISNEPNKQLAEDGFCLVKQGILKQECHELLSLVKQKKYRQVKQRLLSNTNLQKIIGACTENSEYQLQDYIWIIEKSFVHTCHRDNNGDFFNKGQQYPSYTMIVYLENMDKCLNIYPKSHTKHLKPYVPMTDPLMNIPCNQGDVILFNANLIHSGTFNSKENNVRIQLKVTHKKDRKQLSYYENFQKVLHQENSVPRPVRKMQRNLSCLFPGVSDQTQDKNIESARGSSENARISSQQKAFSFFFYGSPDYFDLPNAF